MIGFGETFRYRELRDFQHNHRSGATSSSASMGIFVLVAYSCYELTEAMLGSGIISVLFCGLSMAHYSFRNLNDAAQRNIYHVTGACEIEQTGHTVETLLFNDVILLPLRLNVQPLSSQACSLT